MAVLVTTGTVPAAEIWAWCAGRLPGFATPRFVRFVDRTLGRSKMSRKVFLEAVVMVWKLRFDALRGRL